MNISTSNYKEEKDGYEWPRQIRIMGLPKMSLFDGEEKIKERLYNHGWGAFEHSIHLKPYPEKPTNLFSNKSWENWRFEKEEIDNENEAAINEIKDYVKTYLAHRCKCAKKLVLVYCDYYYATSPDTVIIRGKAPIFYKSVEGEFN